MASKLARAFLKQRGIMLQKPHTALELANFSHGTGKRLPYVVIRLRAETGDSKETVDWHPTLADARETVSRLRSAHYADATGIRFAYYIRHIPTGNTYRG